MRDRFVRAVIAHRKQATARRHQRFAELGHSQEGMHGHRHGDAEPFGRAVGDPSVQIFLASISDRVLHKIEAAPVLRDALINGLELARYRDIAWHENLALQRCHQRTHIGLGLGIEIGDRELSALGAEVACAAIGKAVLVGDADDEALLGAQRGHIILLSPKLTGRRSSRLRPEVGARTRTRRARTAASASLMIRDGGSRLVPVSPIVRKRTALAPRRAANSPYRAPRSEAEQPARRICPPAIRPRPATTNHR